MPATQAQEDEDPRITHTAIGAEYSIDRLSEVNWRLLRENLICAERVFDNPAKFPKADRVAIAEKINAHREFIALYGNYAEAL